MSKKISGLKHHRSHSADRFIAPTDQASSSSSSQGVELFHIAEVYMLFVVDRLCVHACVCVLCVFIHVVLYSIREYRKAQHCTFLCFLYIH